MLANSIILSLVAGFVPGLLAAPADSAALGGSISIVDACHEQYGALWGAAHSGNGKNDWYCVNAANGDTGGLNLNEYCALTYGSGSVAVNTRGGLDDWSCT